MLGRLFAGRYHLVRILGKGGMATVYEAEDVETVARVAVKVLDAGFAQLYPTLPKRFAREARAAASLHNPHVVRTHDAGTDPASGDAFIVMDLLDGEDLQGLVDRLGPLRPELALRIIGQGCAALREAHAKGIIHRDIKPANIFVARTGGARVVKLLDFGIARLADDDDCESADRQTDLTRTGAPVGSPRYMSPEQIQGAKDLDARSDVFALGAVLYKLLSGRTPHYSPGASVSEVVLAVSTRPAPPVQDSAPWVAPEVAVIVHRALALARDDRYPNVDALAAALVSIVGPLEILEDQLTSLTESERSSVSARWSMPSPTSAPAGSSVVVRRTGRDALMAVAIGAAIAVAVAATWSRARPTSSVEPTLPVDLATVAGPGPTAPRAGADAGTPASLGATSAPSAISPGRPRIGSKPQGPVPRPRSMASASPKIEIDKDFH